MAIDLDAIAEAIAARYAPGLLTPPAGLDAIRSSSANLPNNLGALPLVLTFLESGELTPGNGTRLGDHRFLVRFYLAETGDWTRHSDQLRRWAAKLLDVHLTGAQLGGLVAAVRTRGWRIGSMRYAGQTYAGAEMRLQVVTSDSWAPTA